MSWWPRLPHSTRPDHTKKWQYSVYFQLNDVMYMYKTVVLSITSIKTPSAHAIMHNSHHLQPDLNQQPTKSNPTTTLEVSMTWTPCQLSAPPPPLKYCPYSIPSHTMSHQVYSWSSHKAPPRPSSVISLLHLSHLSHKLAADSRALLGQPLPALVAHLRVDG